MSDIADLRMISGLLRRQIWVVFATAAAILSLTAIALILLTPRYTAQALVVVDTSAKNLLAPESAAIASASDNARVEGEVRIAQSDAVLLDVVREGKLADDTEFAPQPTYFDLIVTLARLGHASSGATDVAERETLASFKEAVRVRREGLTYLITVGVTSRDAGKAALLANLVASVYVRHQIDAKVAGTIAARNSLQARVSAAKDSLASHEGRLDAFLIANAGMRDAFSNADTGLRVADAQFNQPANRLVDMVCEIAGKRLHKRHVAGPTGVRGRRSDNRLITEKLHWRPTQSLMDGLEKTYAWIESQLLRSAA